MNHNTTYNIKIIFVNNDYHIYCRGLISGNSNLVLPVTKYKCSHTCSINYFGCTKHLFIKNTALSNVVHGAN